MNEEFWNKFYTVKSSSLSTHSTFAQFVYDNYLKDKSYTIIDIGCGNGRDTLFFSQHAKCIGIDGCMLVIDANRKVMNEDTNIFFCVDIKNIFNFQIPQYLLQEPLFIYARFFLHAISVEEASIFFLYLNSMAKGTKLAIEFRTDKDELYVKSSDKVGELAKTDHYRRFLNFENICEQIKNLGYFIDYTCESAGLSIANNEDPVLGRIVSQKI